MVSAVRVILVTVAGPDGHVDVGVRSDVTPEELASSLSAVLGISEPWPAAEHRSPPRPGDPRGSRAMLVPGVPLSGAGVSDGDLIVFRTPPDRVPPAARLDRSRQAGQLPGAGHQYEAGPAPSGQAGQRDNRSSEGEAGI